MPGFCFQCIPLSAAGIIVDNHHNPGCQDFNLMLLHCQDGKSQNWILISASSARTLSTKFVKFWVWDAMANAHTLPIRLGYAHFTSDCSMEHESIQCDSCECWLRQQCISMSTTQQWRPVHWARSGHGPTFGYDRLGRWPNVARPIRPATAMRANLMMDIMSSKSDREVSSCGFCAVKIIVSIQYSHSIPCTVVPWFETLTHQLNITTTVLVMLSCTEWIRWMIFTSRRYY